VGNGFFTMKHKFTNITQQMQVIYAELDSFAMLRIVYYELVQLNKAFAQNFEYFNSVDSIKRLQSTPQRMCSGLAAKADLAQVQRLACNMSEFNDGFPRTRVNVGQETDSFGASVQSSDKTLWTKPDGWQEDQRQESPLHMTLEHVDPCLGLRFARTYFLSNLAPENYMKFVRFGDKIGEVCDTGL
jgi:uncharacterized protein YukE